MQNYIGIKVSVPAVRFGKQYAKQEFGKEWKTKKFEGKILRKKGKNQYVVKYKGYEDVDTLPLSLVKKYVV